jgi:hypothetical protein
MDVCSAAEVLGISPFTVRLYIKQPKLIPIRIGRRVLLDPAETERFLAEARGAQKKPEIPSQS